MFRYYNPISNNFCSGNFENDSENENKIGKKNEKLLTTTLSADLQDYKDFLGSCTFEGCKRKCSMFCKNKNRKTCTCTHSLKFIEKRNELLAIYYKPQQVLTSLSENENNSLKNKSLSSSPSSNVKKTKTQKPKKAALKKTITSPITIQKINRERKKENQNNLQTVIDDNFINTLPQLSDEFYFFQVNCNLFYPLSNNLNLQ
ncbi:hypothetical protein ACTFIR_005445 [Dictyostelium discoideum]